MNITQELWLILDLCMAALLGFIIGFERKMRFKEAGIRTHTMVCIGSALIMMISRFAFSDEADSARVAAQIVSGVGFLGAGMIVYRQSGVSGLTTAAGVWTTAGVGMACGGGMYVLAAGATVVIVLLQCLFHINCRLFNRKRYYLIKVTYCCTEIESDVINKIFHVNKLHYFTVKKVGEEMLCVAKVNTDKEYSTVQIKKIMAEYPFITSIERCDSD